MTDKKLWTVTMQTEVVVVAENEFEAEESAQAALREGDLDHSSVVQGMSYIPSGWNKNSIPWGDRSEEDPDRTLGQWIELGAAPEYQKSLAEAKKVEFRGFAELQSFQEDLDSK